MVTVCSTMPSVVPMPSSATSPGVMFWAVSRAWPTTTMSAASVAIITRFASTGVHIIGP